MSGLLLMLVGAWGGVAPFVGPTFGFGFTPDRAWQYTTGRLYLSALPGVLVLLAGLVVAITRSRWLAGICAILAALGGAWFIAGAALIRLLPAGLGVASVSAGSPIAATPSAAVLTGLGVFTGVGACTVFLAALALGRFSVVAQKDYERFGPEFEELVSPGDAGALALSGYGPAQPAGPYPPGQFQYPPQYPVPYQYPAPDQYQVPGDPYPTAVDQPAVAPDPGQVTHPYPAAQEQYTPAPTPPGAGDAYIGGAAQYPTVTEMYPREPGAFPAG